MCFVACWWACARDEFHHITWNIVHLHVQNLVFLGIFHQSICIYRKQLNLSVSDAIKCSTKLPNNNFQNYRVHFPICCSISEKGVKTEPKEGNVREQDTFVQVLIAAVNFIYMKWCDGSTSMSIVSYWQGTNTIDIATTKSLCTLPFIWNKTLWSCTESLFAV